MVLGIETVTGTSCRNWLGRFLASCGGAAAVEFALIVSVFVMILFGIITVGWVFFLQNNLETAARAAARHMAVWDAVGIDPPRPVTCDELQATALSPKAGCPPGVCVDQPTAENVACTWFAQMARTAITVEAADCCLAPASDLCLPLDDTSVVVEVRVDGSDAAILDIFGFFGGVTMRGNVNMRREEECT